MKSYKKNHKTALERVTERVFQSLLKRIKNRKKIRYCVAILLGIWIFNFVLFFRPKCFAFFQTTKTSLIFCILYFLCLFFDCQIRTE